MSHLLHRRSPATVLSVAAVLAGTLLTGPAHHTTGPSPYTSGAARLASADRRVAADQVADRLAAGQTRAVADAAVTVTVNPADLRRGPARASRSGAHTGRAAATAVPSTRRTPRGRRAGRQLTTGTALPAGAAGAVVAAALTHLGAPYVYGAAGPYGYDCSGLAVAAYAAVGVRLPHSTSGMLSLGRPVDRAAMRPGDLVFLSSSHVAIYLGGDRMVVAPHSGTHVTIQTIYAFYAARRIL